MGRCLHEEKYKNQYRFLRSLSANHVTSSHSGEIAQAHFPRSSFNTHLVADSRAQEREGHALISTKKLKSHVTKDYTLLLLFFTQSGKANNGRMMHVALARSGPLCLVHNTSRS